MLFLWINSAFKTPISKQPNKPINQPLLEHYNAGAAFVNVNLDES